jgi:hypothetical protein
VLLTLGASGDDINVIRLLAPAVFQECGPVPLDDDNADFISEAQSPVSANEELPMSPLAYSVAEDHPISWLNALRPHELVSSISDSLSVPLRC